MKWLLKLKIKENTAIMLQTLTIKKHWKFCYPCDTLVKGRNTAMVHQHPERVPLNTLHSLSISLFLGSFIFTEGLTWSKSKVQMSNTPHLTKISISRVRYLVENMELGKELQDK